MTRGTPSGTSAATAPNIEINLDAPSFDERFGVFEGWLAQIAAATPGTPTCVDLGCGPGTLSIAAAKCGYRVVSVDGSDKMLEIAAREARRGGVTLDLRHMELPLSDDALRALEGSADVVIASSVIEYLDDPERFLAQCRSLLRPGGVALVSFANSRSIARLAQRQLHRAGLSPGSISRSRSSISRPSARPGCCSNRTGCR